MSSNPAWDLRFCQKFVSFFCASLDKFNPVFFFNFSFVNYFIFLLLKGDVIVLVAFCTFF